MARTNRKATSKLIREFVGKAKKIVEDISVQRDNLRDLLAEYEDVLTECDQVYCDFASAIDKLSGFM